MTSSNSDRQMATEENEYYWRLNLFLNEGVSFLSRGIIVRKLDVLGQDLSSLLRENKKQIKKNDNLDLSDLDILFPVDGETNMDKWNPNMYLCVILELFQKSLETKERTKLKAVQQVLKDLYKRQDGNTINIQTYEEHVYNLEEAFLVLAFNEDSSMKIVEIKKIYINEPLNFDSLQDRMAKMEFPTSTQQNLKKILGTIYDGCNENQFETFENTENSDKKHEDIGQDIGFDKKQTKDAVVNNSIKGNNTEVGSDEIGACGTNEDSEHSSDGIGTVVTAAEVESEIVSIANKPQTDKETKCVARQLDMKRFEESLRNKDLETFISEELNRWEKERVNIAVIGRSGVGKSRFINALRGCKYGDPEYAKIDVIEATMSVQKYPDPNNSFLVYWDLPGLGTDKFPRDKYIEMEEINFDSYDIYLIVSADRFTEDDSYLAEIIEKSGKTFLFVRTKADINEEEYTDFKSVLEKIRKECVEKLRVRERKLQATDVYLISSKIVDHKLLDFGRLVERLVVSLPDLKKEALLSSCRFSTRAVIQEKKSQLINRAVIASAASGAAGAVPVPGFSFCVDSKLIIDEINTYRHILFITEKDLENLAKKTRIAVNELKNRYKLKSFTFFTAKGAVQFSTILPLLIPIAMSEVAENTVKILPVIGTTIGAGISYYTTYKLLTSMIEILVQDAEKMLDILLEKTGSSLFQSN